MKVSIFSLFIFSLFFCSCSQNASTATFGELDSSAVAMDTIMQRKFETSYEYQQDLAIDERKYEVKSTSYIKDGKQVNKCLVIFVTKENRDTIYNQTEPASIYKTELADLNNDGKKDEVVAYYNKNKTDKAIQIFSFQLNINEIYSPKMTTEKMYRGFDSFYVEENFLVHYFPLFESLKDSTPKGYSHSYYQLKNQKLAIIKKDAVL